MDVLPRALLTKMTVLSTMQSDLHRKASSPAKARQQTAKDEDQAAPSTDSCRLPEVAPRSPSLQMSVDYPEPGVLHGSVVGSTATLAQVRDPWWFNLYR